jgi:hypothetical protein
MDLTLSQGISSDWFADIPPCLVRTKLERGICYNTHTGGGWREGIGR